MPKKFEEYEDGQLVYFFSDLNVLSTGKYIPFVGEKGDTQCTKMDWDWGTDEEIAQYCLNKKNSGLLGIPPTILEDGTEDYSVVEEEAYFLYMRIQSEALREKELLNG